MIILRSRDSSKYKRVRNYFLDIGISLAHKRPDIVINFKVDSNLSEGILCYEDMIPSNVSHIVDNCYKIGNKTNQNNEFKVYLKPLFVNPNSNHREKNRSFSQISYSRLC